MKELLSLNAFNRYLGLEIGETNEEGCTVEVKIRPEFYNSLEGVVHGGIISTLADVAMGHGAAPPVGGVQQCVTVECKVNFLSPARGKRLRAESKVLKRGKQLIVMEAKVTDEEGKRIAVAIGTYARISREEP